MARFYMALTLQGMMRSNTPGAAQSDRHPRSGVASPFIRVGTPNIDYEVIINQNPVALDQIPHPGETHMDEIIGMSIVLPKLVGPEIIEDLLRDLRYPLSGGKAIAHIPVVDKFTRSKLAVGPVSTDQEDIFLLNAGLV